MKTRGTRLQNIIIGFLCLRRLLINRLFLYLGICIWIWASEQSATWHVSGYIPMRCVSRQKTGNIMMVPVINVACRQLIQDEKHALFLCPCMLMCSSRLQFADLFHDLPLAYKITVYQTGALFLPSMF